MHGRTQMRRGSDGGCAHPRPTESRSRRAKRVLALACALLLCIGLGLGFGGTAAATQAATLTLTSWETMWIDSNKPDTEGPQSGFLSFLVTNTSDASETLYDVT